MEESLGGGLARFDREAYKKKVKAESKKSPLVKDAVRAFLVGGGIAALGEISDFLFSLFGLGENAGKATTFLLIALACLLTGLGVFDTVARFAGAGTLVPITGFANAVASSALDTKSEGFILGMGAKIFTVAGPVLLYTVLSGAVYGILLFCFG